MKALITGASSGIGKEMAKYLSSKGYEIILVAREEDKLKEVQKELKTKSEIICMDLGDSNNCIKLHEIVKNIDILINCAGFGSYGFFDETDLDNEINMINLNILAVHVLTKLYLKDMIEKNNGYILNVASIAGFMPGPHMATYHATKAYVLKLTQSIYEEVKRKKVNVKISCLCPGPVKTAFLERAKVSFKMRIMSPESVAKIAIDNMFKGKYMIIPGINNKSTRFFSRFFSEKFIGKIVYNKEIEKK